MQKGGLDKGGRPVYDGVASGARPTGPGAAPVTKTARHFAGGNPGPGLQYRAPESDATAAVVSRPPGELARGLRRGPK